MLAPSLDLCVGTLQLRHEPQFRFDWYIKSRTSTELQRRCNTLIMLIEKEMKDTQDKSKKKVSRNGNGTATGVGPGGSPAHFMFASPQPAAVSSSAGTANNAVALAKRKPETVSVPSKKKK